MLMETAERYLNIQRQIPRITTAFGIQEIRRDLSALALLPQTQDLVMRAGQSLSNETRDTATLE
jgi:hypothetical protein